MGNLVVLGLSLIQAMQDIWTAALCNFTNLRRVQEPLRKPRKDTSHHGFESSSCIVLCEESSREDNI